MARVPLAGPAPGDAAREIGRSSSMLGNYERGDAVPAEWAIERLASLYGVAPSTISTALRHQVARKKE